MINISSYLHYEYICTSLPTSPKQQRIMIQTYKSHYIFLRCSSTGISRFYSAFSLHSTSWNVNNRFSNKILKYSNCRILLSRCKTTMHLSYSPCVLHNTKHSVHSVWSPQSSFLKWLLCEDSRNPHPSSYLSPVFSTECCPWLDM